MQAKKRGFFGWQDGRYVHMTQSTSNRRGVERTGPVAGVGTKSVVRLELQRFPDGQMRADSFTHLWFGASASNAL